MEIVLFCGLVRLFHLQGQIAVAAAQRSAKKQLALLSPNEPVALSQHDVGLAGQGGEHIAFTLGRPRDFVGHGGAGVRRVRPFSLPQCVVRQGI